MPSEQRVLLDTDVWTQLYLRAKKGDERVTRWREQLLGVAVAISGQTRAEALAGLLLSNWAEDKLRDSRSQLNRTATIPLDEAVVQRYAELKAECQKIGHALGQKMHAADRWIAATAAAHGLPLLSGDRLFAGVPGLQLFVG